MRKEIKFLLVLICILNYIRETRACSCIPNKSVEFEVERSKTVFLGTVIDIKEKDEFYLNVTFRLLKSWKGNFKLNSDIEKDIFVVVQTCKYSSCCGVKFEENKSYLVYANDGWPQGEDFYNVSLCSRTKILESAEEDVKELEKKYN